MVAGYLSFLSSIVQRDRKLWAMAAITTPNGVRSEFLMTLSGQQIENVIHTDWTGAGPIDGHLDTLNDHLITWWSTNLAPILSNNITLRAVRSTNLSSLTGSVVETAPSSTLTGAIAVESLPNNVAVVVTEHTANRGRSYRGRKYQAGIPSDEATSPTEIAGSDLAALVAAWTTLIAQAVADGIVLAVLSTFTNKAQRAAGVLTPITSMSANTAFDSQRRRLAGRGN